MVINIIKCSNCDNKFIQNNDNDLWCICCKKKYKIQINIVQKRNSQRRRNIELREEIFKLLGNKCERCGFDDYRALQIDHIEGHSSKDKVNIKDNPITGVVYYNKVLNTINNKQTNKYQLLCANCNWIKRSENKETRKRLDDTV